MEKLAREAAGVAALAVHRVANDRDSGICQVRPDLVRPSGHRPHVQKRLAIGGRPPCGEPDEPSHRVAAAGADDHAPPVVRVAEQRRLDDRGGISGISPDEREVLLAESLRLQLSSERQMRDVILRDDEHAARVLVEPMHDPGT